MADELKIVKEHAAYLKNLYGQRDNKYKKMTDLYFLKWGEQGTVEKQFDNVKLTKSPRARNAAKGMIRLLTAADLMFQVPYSANSEYTKDKSEKLEKFAASSWARSNRIKGRPITYDMATSAVLYSDVHLAITSTADLVKWSKGGSAGAVKRAESYHRQTPFLFDVWNPTNGYPEHTDMGLSAYYRQVKTSAKDILTTWGAAGQKAISAMQQSSETNLWGVDVVLNDYYDLEKRVVWLSESDTPIHMDAHDLPFIPVVANIVEGSRLFDEMDERVDPFLWTIAETGLLERQNLLLTVLYTMAFSIGSNPMFIHSSIDPEAPLIIDQKRNIIRVRTGEDFKPLGKNVIDPSILQGWNIATDLETESTIYRQTLGEPLGAEAPYSMVALLSQSGRLPLIMSQKMIGFAAGSAMRMCMEWLKDKGGVALAKPLNEQGYMELSSEEIPDDVEITAKLDVDLPFDKLNAANVANMLTQGENPLASQRWARENILNIGQSDEMTEEIWGETVGNLFARKYALGEMAKMAQLEQMAMRPESMMPQQQQGMPGQPPMMPEGMVPPQGSPEAVTPEQLAEEQLPPEPPPFPPMPPPQEKR